MAPIVKRLISSCVIAAMSLALLPAASAFGDESVPEWARDPDYHAVIPSAPDDLPSSFDLRDRGVVTPVRLQDPYSSCWSFSAIAAAEISIISDLGAPADLDLSEKHLAWFGMHPVQEVDDPNQAGEGLSVFDEDVVGSSAAYTGTNPLVVSTIFSTGVGPVYENDTDGLQGFPYRGKEGLTEQDVLFNDAYKGRWTEDKRRRLIQACGSEEDALKALLESTSFKSIDEYLEQEWEQRRKNFKDNFYSDLDDWSIPATNEAGESNRNVFVGYTLRDANSLPALRKLDRGAWVGVNEEGIWAAKRELMAGHGIDIGFCADRSLPGIEETGGYMNKKTWSHYTRGTDRVNHGVCIVGWDDNYPASKFTHALEDADDDEAFEYTTPPGDGAWICKNSWGCASGIGTAVNDESQVLGKTDWGVDGSGYFYISYYDNTLDQPQSYTFDNDLDGEEFYSHVYDYMPSMVPPYEVSDTKVISTANVFTAEEDEQVVSVSTRSAQSNSRATFALYRLSDDAKSPVDGELVETHSYDMAYGGFHRLDLTDPFTVKAGQKFSVVSTVSRAAGDGTFRYEALADRGVGRETAKRTGATFYATAVVHKGESYLYHGGAWHDWADYLQNHINDLDGDVVDNFSIKAFALPWDGVEPDTEHNLEPQKPAKEEEKPSGEREGGAKGDSKTAATDKSDASKGSDKSATSKGKSSGKTTPSASDKSTAAATSANTGASLTATRGNLPGTGDEAQAGSLAALLVSGCMLLAAGARLCSHSRRAS